MNMAYICMIIILLALISFIWEKIPIVATALIAALAMAFLGIIELKDVYSAFSGTTAVMVMGMIIVGASLFDTGLAPELGKVIERSRLARDERLFMGLMCAVATFASTFLSNSAVVAMMLPIIALVTSRSNGKIRNKMVVLPMVVGSMFGGRMSVIGTTSPMILQGFLMEAPDTDPMAFFELAAVTLPVAILYILFMYFIGHRIMERTIDFTEDPMSKIFSAEVASRQDQSGKIHLTWQMWVSGITCVGCIILFIVQAWNPAIIALLGCAVLFGTKAIDLRSSLAKNDWNTVWLLVFASGFASGLQKSGASTIIVNFMIEICKGDLLWLAIVGVVLSSTISNFMSGSAVTIMLVPIWMEIARNVGADPKTFAMLVTIGGGLQLITPIGTPCMTQGLVAGYKFLDYTRTHWVPQIVSLAMTVLIGVYYYGLI